MIGVGRGQSFVKGAGEAKGMRSLCATPGRLDSNKFAKNTTLRPTPYTREIGTVFPRDRVGTDCMG